MGFRSLDMLFLEKEGKRILQLHLKEFFIVDGKYRIFILYSDLNLDKNIS
jgi:hypothetical protein